MHQASVVDDVLLDTRHKSLHVGWQDSSTVATSGMEVAVVVDASMERLGVKRASLLGWTRWTLVATVATSRARELPSEHVVCPWTEVDLAGCGRVVSSYSATPMWKLGDAEAREAEDLAAS